MKKILLFGAASLLASTSALAAQPMELGDFAAYKISPNGKIVGSSAQSSVSIFYVDSEDYVNFLGDDTDTFSYSLGQGNCITDSGIIVGESKSDGGACVYKNGEWTPLIVPNPSLSNLANAITPDALRICGSIGLQKISTDDYPTPMLVPAIWDLQSDGTYGEPVRLPYPELDFSGRVPQYVTANWISDDGKTIVGQVVDYSGFFPIMICYRLGDDNQWTYSTGPKELYNPNNVVFPEYPGDGPMRPSIEDYMTDAEIAAYNAAYDEWYNNCMETGNWDDPNPVITDFISEEGLAAYNEALAEWQVAQEEWQAKDDAFYAAFYDCVANGKPLVFNTIALSADGKVVAYCTSEEGEIDENEPWNVPTYYRVLTFNLDDESYKLYPRDNVSPQSITNDYCIYVNSCDREVPTQGSVYVKGEEILTPIIDYVSTRNNDIAAWMKENMFHDIEAYNFETGEFYMLEDVNCTGYPTATPNNEVIVSYVDNYWDDAAGFYFGYYMPLGPDAAVKGIASDADFTVKAVKGGKIILTGEVENVTVYDANGSVLFNGAPASDVIETGLAAGAYIVKATGANGDKIVKAMF